MSQHGLQLWVDWHLQMLRGLPRLCFRFNDRRQLQLGRALDNLGVASANQAKANYGYSGLLRHSARIDVCCLSIQARPKKVIGWDITTTLHRDLALNAFEAELRITALDNV